VRESRDRVRERDSQLGLRVSSAPDHRQLAPADVRKAGASFDLPIASASGRSGIVERRHAPELILLGELSLDGSIHATAGSWPIAAAAPARGVTAILLPAANAG